jgi:hypothetical protein
MDHHAHLFWAFFGMLEFELRALRLLYHLRHSAKPVLCEVFSR